MGTRGGCATDFRGLRVTPPPFDPEWSRSAGQRGDARVVRTSDCQERPGNDAACQERMPQIKAGDAGVAPTAANIQFTRPMVQSTVIERKILRPLVLWKACERVLARLTVIP